MSQKNQPSNGYWVYTTYFTKNGKTYYAKDYGKKAFRFWKSNKKA